NGIPRVLAYVKSNMTADKDKDLHKNKALHDVMSIVMSNTFREELVDFSAVIPFLKTNKTTKMYEDRAKAIWDYYECASKLQTEVCNDMSTRLRLGGLNLNYDRKSPNTYKQNFRECKYPELMPAKYEFKFDIPTEDTASKKEGPCSAEYVRSP